MVMKPGLRKFVLTAHITFAVGWIGAVAGFLALAIVGITNKDVQVVRSIYLAMQIIARFVIVPLSFAPLLTGPFLSLGTPWGLFRHYWILAKLLITIFCTVVMQIHMQPINILAGAVAKTTLSSTEYNLQIQMVVASSAALLALLMTTILGVYKPQGMTPYGWRKQDEKRTVLSE